MRWPAIVGFQETDTAEDERIPERDEILNLGFRGCVFTYEGCAAGCIECLCLMEGKVV
jgi:hypothetical protein